MIEMSRSRLRGLPVDVVMAFRHAGQGEQLAALDRQAARNPGDIMRWTNRATNTADARRVFRGWADQLRTFLESHYAGEK